MKSFLIISAASVAFVAAVFSLAVLEGVNSASADHVSASHLAQR